MIYQIAKWFLDAPINKTIDVYLRGNGLLNIVHGHVKGTLQKYLTLNVKQDEQILTFINATFVGKPQFKMLEALQVLQHKVYAQNEICYNMITLLFMVIITVHAIMMLRRTLIRTMLSFSVALLICCGPFVFALMGGSGIVLIDVDLNPLIYSMYFLGCLCGIIIIYGNLLCEGVAMTPNRSVAVDKSLAERDRRIEDYMIQQGEQLANLKESVMALNDHVHQTQAMFHTDKEITQVVIKVLKYLKENEAMEAKDGNRVQTPTRKTRQSVR